MPSNWAATNAIPGSFTASANSWSWTSRVPKVSLSELMNPSSEPLPYWMANWVLFCCRRGKGENEGSELCMMETAAPATDRCARQATHLVGRRLGGVILIVQVAGDVEEAAVRRWHPQVGAASVKDDLEFLRGGPQPDFAIILRRAETLIEPRVTSTPMLPGVTQ